MFRLSQLSSLTVIYWKTKMSVSKITGVLIFTLAFSYACSSHANDNNFEYSSDNIAGDFVNITVVPRAWEVRVWEWFQQKIDVRNKSTEDLSLLSDYEPKEEFIKALAYLSQLETYKTGHVIQKIKDKAYVSKVNNKEMEIHIKSIIPIINQAVGKKLIVYSETSDRKTPAYINIRTMGKKMTGAIDFCTDCVPPPFPSRVETPGFRFAYGFPVVAIEDMFKPDIVVYDATTDFSGTALDGFNFKSFDSVTRFIDLPLFLQKGRDRFLYHVDGYTAVKENKSSDIGYADCFINLDLPDYIFKALTTECLLRSLGLYNRSNNPNSNVGFRKQVRNSPDGKENIDWIEQPTEYDLLLVNLLYDERIKAGMNKTEVLDTVKSILSNMDFSHLK